MNEPRTQPPTIPANEILTRTRSIDDRTQRLLSLLSLLEEPEGASPPEALREALIEILVEQREVSARLGRIEAALLGQGRATRP